MELNLVDRVAIVTGGAKGIGKEIAVNLSREGAAVVIADLDREAAEQAAQEILASGRRAIAVAVDVADEKSVKGMVDRAIEAFGKIDILVNSAGYISIAAPTELQGKEWDRVMSINAKGVFLCCKAVARHMMERAYGKILNISSQASKLGYPFEVHYSAAKAAVNGFTRSLASYLAGYSINVNAICPGSIETEMNKKVTEETAQLLGVSFEDKWRDTVKNTPLKRKGTVKDVADVAVFLVSDRASFLTGQAINVTGGRVMH